MKWAWSEDPLKSQPEIKKTMSLEAFRLMLKHFRVVKSSALPPKQSVDYHPLQNINNGVIYLRNRALSMWQIGSKLCIEEGRVRSKSRRNPFKVRNPNKPIRMGWTVCKISDKGQYGGYFVCNHVVKVGKKSYVHPQNGKNYDIVDQLTAGLKNSGRLVVMDSGFPTLKLMNDSWQLWRTQMIATQHGNTAHMPSNHKVHLKKAKKFVRGFSQTLHHDNITVTYWNDNNVVTFLDNGIPSGREHWDTMEVNQGADREIIHVPKVAELYKEIYGWVDRGNQQLSYYYTEFRSVRKQNRVLDSLIEMYVLVNGHTLWQNSPNLMCNVTRENMSQSEFRFAVIRIWYAMFRKTNGRIEVLHYPVNKQTHHR